MRIILLIISTLFDLLLILVVVFVALAFTNVKPVLYSMFYQSIHERCERENRESARRFEELITPLE